MKSISGTKVQQEASQSKQCHQIAANEAIASHQAVVPCLGQQIQPRRQVALKLTSGYQIRYKISHARHLSQYILRFSKKLFFKTCVCDTNTIRLGKFNSNTVHIAAYNATKRTIVCVFFTPITALAAY
jgi:hypothetical protein